MADIFAFHRFDRDTKADGFKYETIQNVDLRNSDVLSMDKSGFNIHVTIQNFMHESVLLGGNLRTNPTLIKSLRRDDLRHRENLTNHVIITIHYSENAMAVTNTKRDIRVHKTEIKIPGSLLNQGSIFVHELDCYLMTESQIDATRELIARDVMHNGWTHINVPSTMIKQNPETLYIASKDLIRYCLERQDKISVRIGYDLTYNKPPPHVKNLIIAIQDSYFNPYTCNKMVYDPTLDPDTFVIENLYLASDQEFMMSFSELADKESVYLDPEQVKTLFGTYYALALFTDRDRYLNYVYKRKTQERFDEETQRVAYQTGDPLLKEKITALNQTIDNAKQVIDEKIEENKQLSEKVKDLKAQLRDREQTIDHLKTHQNTRMGIDYIEAEMTNATQRVANEARKIDIEEEELEHKAKAIPLAHKAAIWKTIADIMKSGWGILTACVTGVLALLAVCKKFGVVVSMAG